MAITKRKLRIEGLICITVVDFLVCKDTGLFLHKTEINLNITENGLQLAVGALFPTQFCVVCTPWLAKAVFHDVILNRIKIS